MTDGKTPVIPEDIYQLGWLEDPRLSPDGRTVAYVQVSVDKAKNKYRRDIWLAAADGTTPPRRFTSGQWSDHSPRWSPDGQRLAFVSNREGDKDQIYVIYVDGGEGQPLTSHAGGARSPAWSPDGTRIAFVARLTVEEQAREEQSETAPPEDKWLIEQRKLEERRRAEEEADPRVTKRLPFRTGTTFIDDKRSHLYVITSDPDAADRTPRRLTSGDLNWGAPTWAPDGQSLLATCPHDPDRDSLFIGRAIYRVPLSGGEPELLAGPPFSYVGNGPAGAPGGPQTSPNGRWIATLRIPEERATSRNTRLAVFPARPPQPPNAGGSEYPTHPPSIGGNEGGHSGEVRDLTVELDRSVLGFRWSPDSRLLCMVEDYGDTHVYHVDFESGEARFLQENGFLKVYNRIVGGRRIIDQFDAGAGGRVAFVASSPDRHSDLWVAEADGSERRLTDIHAKLLDTRDVTPAEEVRYPAPDGLEIQGWVLYPRDFDPTGHFPLAVFIHGGPHTMWGPSFRTMWPDWQSAVGRGYVVFFCNPRGSEGYGQAFQEALHDGWGEADYRDILAGIDHIVARGGIDPNRICVTGGSYGGYMTAWLVGHDTRFRAAVAQRGVYHLMSFYGTSDAYELIENEFEGLPWHEVEKLWRHSPIAYAHNIQTPLLILHADLDFRVPISDAEQLFAVLRRLGKTVELVRYPREGHELTRSGEPKHRVDHLTRILDWFDKYVVG